VSVTLERQAQQSLWPTVDRIVHARGLAGLALGVVQDGEVALARGFGTRDVRTGEPVQPDTMFHLASLSKPFVATAVIRLANPGPGLPEPALDLDAPVVRYLPGLTLADGRQGEIIVRHLLTHTSGIPDVDDYGWHDPQLGDDALAEFVRTLADKRLASDPGARFSYSNTGYEVLGHLVATVTGTTFEAATKALVLNPAGMARSTFLRAEVPPELAASPHVGAPLVVPDESYPYTRSHAPSSTLHSNVLELCGWMAATLADPGRERAWQRQVEIGDPPWGEAMGFGWFLGTERGHRTVGHAGSDPGFECRLMLLPDLATGVVVLANSDTAPLGTLVRAALDLALGGPAGRTAAPATPFTLPVAAALASRGTDAAVETFHRLAPAEPGQADVQVEEAVWGAIELHRTDLVRPLLDVWTTARPDSSPAWTMTGWAHLVDGETDRAATLLRRALDLDAGNDDAAALLRGLERDVGGGA
jgi:CubicO group peptidase (beta-lactamase class C family)